MWVTCIAYITVGLSTQHGKPSAVLLRSYTNTSSIHNTCVPGMSIVHNKWSICFIALYIRSAASALHQKAGTVLLNFSFGFKNDAQTVHTVFMTHTKG